MRVTYFSKTNKNLADFLLAGGIQYIHARRPVGQERCQDQEVDQQN